MASIILPRRFCGQPQNIPAIDYGNPITRGIVFAGIPNGTSLVNVVTGNRGLLSGAAPPTPAIAANGKNLLFNSGIATNSYLNFGAGLDTSDLALGPATWFFWVVPTGRGGIAERNDSNAVNIGWGIGLDSTLNLSFIKEFSTSNLSAKSTSSLISGAVQSVAVTYDGTSLSAVNFYIGGRPDPVSASNAGSGASGSDSAKNLYLGRLSFSSNASIASGSMSGNIAFGAMFRRVLSDAEIASLHQNSFQIFKAPQRRLWVEVASSGVSFTGATSQGQTAAASASLASAASASSSQAQSTAAAGGISSTASSATVQGQSAEANAAISVSATSSASQAQSVQAAAAVATDGTASSSQAQSVAGAGATSDALSTEATTGQAQSAVATGSIGADAQASTKQGQQVLVATGISAAAAITSRQGQSVAAHAATAIDAVSATSQAQSIGGARYAPGTGTMTARIRIRPAVGAIYKTSAAVRGRTDARPA